MAWSAAGRPGEEAHPRAQLGSGSLGRGRTCLGLLGHSCQCAGGHMPVCLSVRAWWPWAPSVGSCLAWSLLSQCSPVVECPPYPAPPEVSPATVGVGPEQWQLSTAAAQQHLVGAWG